MKLQAIEPAETENAEAMKTAPRRRRRRLALAALLATAWFVVGPWPHSWLRHSLLRNDCESQTQRRFEQAVRDTPRQCAPGPLRVGAGAVDVTEFAKDATLAGYGKRALFKTNTGVADPVQVKALVMDNGRRRVAVVTADLLLFNRRLVSGVMKALGSTDTKWRREDVFFGATHTHSGPGGFPGTPAETLGLGFTKPALARRLIESVCTAIESATADLTPAQWAHAAADTGDRLIRNRTIESGGANRWLDVIHFRTAESQAPIATVAIFSAHATCRRSSDLRLSADYPGQVCRMVEDKIGGTCLFLAGSVGSMGPPDHQVPRDRLTKWLGSQLGRRACRLICGQMKFRRRATLEAIGHPVVLPTPQVRLGKGFCLSPIAAGRLLPAEAWIHGLRLGNVALLGAPADFSGVIACELRNQAPDVTAVVTSFSGDYVGYVLPETYYDLDCYETSMTFHGPELGPQMHRTLARLLHAMTTESTPKQ